MHYFIGLVPPKGLKKRVVRLRERWGYKAVEPHITVKAQGGLTGDQYWMEKVEAVCHSTAPIKVKLGDPHYFGVNVLYLSVYAPEVIQLHKKIVHTIDPGPELVKQYFELDQYVPHLTITQQKRGILLEQLKEIECQARIELGTFPYFTVDFVRVYYHEQGMENYEKLKDIPLGAS